MICPKCGSENVNMQVVQDVKVKTKHHSIFWWLFIGWWWIPIKWLIFTLPALIIAIFKPRRTKVVTKEYTMCVCQNCGYNWKK